MLNYFSDPIVRAPVIGCMLMCLSASLIGVLIFLRKQSLIGETLSHTSYLGVTLAVLLSTLLGLEGQLSLSILVGAFSSSLLGYFTIDYLKKKIKIREDAALCFILASFFGMGVLVASLVQVVYPYQFRSIQAYLYGQAATMRDLHLLLYGILSLVIVTSIVIFYRQFQTLCFDHEFALASGASSKKYESFLIFLVALSIIIGIRVVGVILMSAMLIAPAISARQYTDHLGKMFFLAGLFGVVSAFLGVISSFHFSELFFNTFEWKGSFPTGPMIVLCASLMAFFSLLFSPKRGLAVRYFRIATFRFRCLEENLLKAIWRQGSEMEIREIKKLICLSKPMLWIMVGRLRYKKWIAKRGKNFALTAEGRRRGSRIIRLHRLWEVYLVDYLGVGREKVHKNAEEMEHILTPALEEELMILLNHPHVDPHDQPIPKKEGASEGLSYG